MMLWVYRSYLMHPRRAYLSRAPVAQRPVRLRGVDGRTADPLISDPIGVEQPPNGRDMHACVAKMNHSLRFCPR